MLGEILFVLLGRVTIRVLRSLGGAVIVVRQVHAFFRGFRWA